jgi:hypothetical protein
MWNMPDPAPREDSADQAATASYVAELTAHLAVLARRDGLATLGFILEMAKLEAENAARAGKQPN